MTVGHYQSPCGNTVLPAPSVVYPVWKSENSSIATVNGVGTVTGVAPGQTEIDVQYGVNFVTIKQSSCAQVWEELTTGAVTTVNPSQVPYADRIVSTTYNSAIPACPGGAADQPGWRRDVKKIVTDQTGKDIVAAGQILTETVVIGSPNALLPPGTKPVTGTTQTVNVGQYTDSLYACSASCPATTGQTSAMQTIADTYKGIPFTLQSNQFVYKCSGITVNGR